MKLSNVDAAFVPKAKVVDYLLSPTHRIGKNKAAFFLSFDFSREQWTELKEALLLHAREHDISDQEETPFGRRYSIDGTMLAPSGDRLNVRTAWFIDKGDNVPRFVTAHPLKKRKA